MEDKIEKAQNPLAVITGASSGIGYALAKVFAKHGYDLLVTAEDLGIAEAGNAFHALGVQVETFQSDLSTYEGVENLYAKIKSLHRPVDCIAMNAGFGVGGEFINIDLEKEIELIQLNNISLVHLSKRLLPDMIVQGHGRILYTSSIAATMPGPYYAVYAASKAFVQSFAEAIRIEVKEKGITVTALQPGATDTNFFARADMLDTKAAVSKKDDPAEVAEEAYEALMAGKDHVITGSFMNTVQAKVANIISDPVGAKMQSGYTKPGSGH